jgi:hypothetical protein
MSNAAERHNRGPTLCVRAETNGIAIPPTTDLSFNSFLPMINQDRRRSAYLSYPNELISAKARMTSYCPSTKAAHPQRSSQ